MATINLSVIAKMREVITTLIFRNKASVGIRKIKREKAYTQAVDIIITSIAYNLSENFKAEPPIQFYGYAVLVMQDCTEISIPIVSPRQRLYYGVQHEAIRQWRHWIEFYQLYQLHRFNDISLASIMGALEIPYTENLPEIKENEWIELPIREVYVKLQDKTQFELEFTQWEPIPFTDPIHGVEIDGKSNQADGDKDNGLPKDGIQPKKNAPNSPFNQNPPPSSIQNAGQNGFDLLDSSKLGDSDPDNSVTVPADPAGTKYWLKIVVTEFRDSFPSGCSVPRISTNYYELLDATVRATLVPRGDFNFQNPCGGVITRSDLFLTGGLAPLFFLNVEGGSPTLSYGQGLVIPSDSMVFGT